jgi:hypothetical protein
MADPAYIVDGVLTDGEAWVGIAHAAVSLPAASVTFTSTDDGQTGDFSQYMDLMLVIYVATTHAAASSFLWTNLNGDTGSNYPYQYFTGEGAVSSYAGTTDRIDTRVCAAASSTNVFSAITINLFDVNSGKYKSTVQQTASDLGSTGQVSINASTWLSQAPITSITFTDHYSANIAAGSKFSLFGILPRMVA